MTCHYCKAICKRFGRHRNGLQRFRCLQCHKTFTEDHEKPLDDMRVPVDRAVSVLKLLLEGMSIRSVERLLSFQNVQLGGHAVLDAILGEPHRVLLRRDSLVRDL